jgi:predicted nucleic acid-binding protein
VNLTIDASVFVAALRQTEIHHADSLAFLSVVTQEGSPIFCPTLVLAETIAAIARATGDAALVQQATLLLETMPNMNLVVLDEAQARQAAQLAAQYRLRGADAVYLAVTVQEGTTLVAWDDEMRTRGGTVCPVLTPTDFLTSYPPTP